ncbi:hypothetical protein NDU88_001043 [Pleurodeles waltl]|uniref:Uncharacterized protein n=1 Tax=Pleurodeles waltl TaxID=8319 RepID=A0AAV7V8D9_PLEWA|nr:hypothetical protein NDU88_001043 [Pleurodeles waltl]
MGPRPSGAPDLRRASPIPGGSGAAQCRSRLLLALTPGLRCHTFRETLSGLPLCLRPSACARQQPAASRDAPAPAEVEGGPGPPGSPQASLLPRGPGAIQCHSPHSTPGPPTELRLLGLVQFQIYGAQPLWGPPISAGLHQSPGDRVRPSAARASSRRRPSVSDVSLSGRPSRVLPSAHSSPPSLGVGPQPHAKPRLQPRGRAAGLLRCLQPGPRRRSLQGSNGGPVASRTGPQYAALTRVLNFPEMARFFYGLMSATPERGD